MVPHEHFYKYVLLTNLQSVVPTLNFKNDRTMVKEPKKYLRSIFYLKARSKIPSGICVK